MKRPLATLMGTFAICLTLIGCSEPPPLEPVEMVRPVKSFLIETTSNGGIRSFPARIDAGRKAELSFRVSGVLKQLPVKEGDQVEEGELVAALDGFSDFNIGHSIVSRAVFVGIREAVRQMKEAIARGVERGSTP